MKIHHLKSELITKNALKAMCVVVASVLSACGGGAGSSSTASGGGVAPTASASVSIDAMTAVPVLNGTSTKGTLYLHNYGNQVASGLEFGVGSKAITTTALKTMLNKVGLHLGGLEDTNGFVILNPEHCSQIAANSSCAINFQTPNLAFGDRGNSLVTLSYKSAGKKSLNTSQVVNYQYVNPALISGVNFTGSLAVVGSQGSTQHVVGYLYGGGAVDSSYKNVNLASSNVAVNISGGFVNGSEVVAGQVVAVEFAVPLQNNTKSSVNVTPVWGASASKVAQSTLQSGTISGMPLSIALTPAQNVVNYLFGSIPTLTAPTSSAATISVVNNGNAAGTGGLTASSDNPGLSITGNCSNTALLPGATNSCQFNFSVTSATPGSATVTFNDGNGAVGSQQVIWTNDKPYPAVYLSPNVTNISMGKANPSGAVIFTVANVGKAPLTGATYLPTRTGPATWVEETTDCPATLGVAGECTIRGHFVGNDDGTGTLYYRALGSYNSVNYSFASYPVDYLVSAAPSLAIDPATPVTLTVLANGVSVATQTYTVTNEGNDPALFTNIVLNNKTTQAAHHPVITGGTCNTTTTLAENDECTVIVSLGPVASDATANEAGVDQLDIAYHGGTPDVDQTVQSADLSYSVVGNDTTVSEVTTSENLTGSGTSNDPYSGNAKLDPMLITTTYTNPSVNYDLINFNLDVSQLPYGLVVDSTSTCKTGAETMTLPKLPGNHSCTLVLRVDREALKTSPQGGLVVLDFTQPSATWTTPLGFYTQSGETTFIDYVQPGVALSVSTYNAATHSNRLTMTLTNADAGVSPIVVDVAGVKQWLETAPINPTSNCTLNASTYALSCNLSAANSVGAVDYVMPDYLAVNETAMIPLMYSTSNVAALSSSYSMIIYTVIP